MLTPQVNWPSTSDGGRIAVHEVGAGEPILLIPGLGYAAWSFTRQMAALADSAHVLAVDNRGAGLSSGLSGPSSIEQMADDAYAVLKQRTGAAATVVGTSMGGYIAQMLAQKYPSAVKSLVLVATTCGGPGSQGVPEATLQAWERAASSSENAFARATMPLSFAPGWCEEHPAEFEELLALREQSPTSSAAWRAQFAACAEFLRDGLAPGEVSSRVTIVHGTLDRVVPYGNTRCLTGRFPGATLRTLEGAGHLCWIERADEFNGVLVGAR